MSLGGPTCWIQKGRYSINRRQRRCQASSACGWNPSQLLPVRCLFWFGQVQVVTLNLFYIKSWVMLFGLFFPSFGTFKGGRVVRLGQNLASIRGFHKSLQELHHPWHLRFAGGANRLYLKMTNRQQKGQNCQVTSGGPSPNHQQSTDTSMRAKQKPHLAFRLVASQHHLCPLAALSLPACPAC